MKLKKSMMAIVLVAMALTTTAQKTPTSQMERLDRGVVALPAGGFGVFISWRLLGTDPENTTFDVVRNGEVIKSGLKVTNYKDTDGMPASDEYQVVTRVDGVVTETSAPVIPWQNRWLRLDLDRPAGGTLNSEAYTYSPNDCSVGDVDGDGQYELFVKWDPSNSKDNSQNGYTGNVYIDCYKFDGTKLWRIDLGRNIRAGAHYTQFMVYDFDGDGHAEMMCKTAPGSKDGQGNYVNQATTNESIRNADNSKVWLSSSGRMDGGQEYLTVFDGQTGRAVNTIAYNPNRNASSSLSEAEGTFNWAVGKTDNHGYNRGDRYLAAVAYLDGPDQNASAIFCRGYYTYAFIWAVDFDGQQLHPRWLSSHRAATSYSLTTYDADGKGTTKAFTNTKRTGKSSGSGTMYANGNHTMSVADVDGDGRDEIIWGSAALNSDGTLRYATGYGHGDAIHMGEMIPDREGMQVFQIHEEGSNYGYDLHDASTGEIIHSATGGSDNGRGMAAQLSTTSAEWWFSSANDRSQRSASTGEVASSKSASLNFRIYWDGSARDQLLDGNKITKWSGSGFSDVISFASYGPSNTCNGTKNTPNLSADIMGDWREEVILWNVEGDDAYLGIYSTNTETAYRVPTLMHDHTYRMAVCWQNTAYNQPPHLGYNLAIATQPRITSPVEVNAKLNQEMTFTVTADRAKSIMVYRSTTPSGTTSTYKVPTGFTSSIDYTTMTATITGTPEETGDYEIVFRLTGLSSESLYQSVFIHVSEGQGADPDINGDGNVDVGDIMAVINVMSGQAEGISQEAADVNGDGNVDVGDIMAIINVMAGKE